MTPGLNTPTNVLKNEPMNLFVFLNKNFEKNFETEIKVTYFNSVDN